MLLPAWTATLSKGRVGLGDADDIERALLSQPLLERAATSSSSSASQRAKGGGAAVDAVGDFMDAATHLASKATVSGRAEREE